MKHYSIRVDGTHFERDYLVYVIRVIPDRETPLFYVGQTGDRNYQTARPAFSRLAGHFSDAGYSTQNQVYKAIASQILGYTLPTRRAFSEEIKSAVGGYLVHCDILMDAFPVCHFNAEDTKGQHKTKVAFSERVEQHVIALLEESTDWICLNRRKAGDRSDPAASEMAIGILTAILKS